MVLRMNRKSKLGKIIEDVSLYYQSKREGFSNGFRFVLGWGLSVVLFSVITAIAHLTSLVRWIVVVVLSSIMGVIVTRKPRRTLTVVCILLALIGFTLVGLSLNEENATKLGFNAGLLGTGAAVIAIAIAVYALLTQTQREEGVVSLSYSGMDMRNLKEGYIWVQEIKKFRCEYCKHSGRYRYYKTLSGIKKHIASKHV
jgi:hypothetical protein